jgi:hypothetical protein
MTAAGARSDRFARRTGAGDDRLNAVNRICQGWQAAAIGRDQPDPLAWAGGPPSDSERFRAGLSGGHMVWRRRSAQHAVRNHPKN